MPPDFLCIGAQKSGTTWLHRVFARHPQVWMPPEKELHYWDEKRDNAIGLVPRIRGKGVQGERWRRQVRHQWKAFRSDGRPSLDVFRWQARYLLGTPSDKWYVSLFPDQPGLVTGEVTPNYSVLPKEKVRAIAEVLPDLKLIFIIRNPIERAWSHAQMYCVRMWRKEVPATPDDFREHMASRGSRRLTDYLATLDTWTEFFPAERMFLGFLEDVHFRSGELLTALYAFLGVDPARGRDLRSVVHPGKVDTLPVEMALELAASYRPLLAGLSDRFAGHATRWLAMADDLLADPPARRTLDYPLWNDELWSRTAVDPDPPPLCSGVVSAISRA